MKSIWKIFIIHPPKTKNLGQTTKRQKINRLNPVNITKKN